jgi:hypothetical protein
MSKGMRYTSASIEMRKSAPPRGRRKRFQVPDWPWKVTISTKLNEPEMTHTESTVSKRGIS